MAPVPRLSQETRIRNRPARSSGVHYGTRRRISPLSGVGVRGVVEEEDKEGYTRSGQPGVLGRNGKDMRRHPPTGDVRHTGSQDQMPEDGPKPVSLSPEPPSNLLPSFPVPYRVEGRVESIVETVGDKRRSDGPSGVPIESGTQGPWTGGGKQRGRILTSTEGRQVPETQTERQGTNQEGRHLDGVCVGIKTKKGECFYGFSLLNFLVVFGGCWG